MKSAIKYKLVEPAETTPQMQERAAALRTVVVDVDAIAGAEDDDYGYTFEMLDQIAEQAMHLSNEAFFARLDAETARAVDAHASAFTDELWRRAVPHELTRIADSKQRTETYAFFE